MNSNGLYAELAAIGWWRDSPLGPNKRMLAMDLIDPHVGVLRTVVEAEHVASVAATKDMEIVAARPLGSLRPDADPRAERILTPLKDALAAVNVPVAGASSWGPCGKPSSLLYVTFEAKYAQRFLSMTGHLLTNEAGYLSSTAGVTIVPSESGTYTARVAPSPASVKTTVAPLFGTYVLLVCFYFRQELLSELVEAVKDDAVI